MVWKACDLMGRRGKIRNWYPANKNKNEKPKSQKQQQEAGTRVLWNLTNTLHCTWNEQVISYYDLYYIVEAIEAYKS